MKRISDFQELKLNSFELNNLIGGKKVTSRGEIKKKNGCVSYQYDEFDDKDGDGLWDDNESGSFCSITDCPPCLDA